MAKEEESECLRKSVLGRSTYRPHVFGVYSFRHAFQLPSNISFINPTIASPFLHLSITMLFLLFVYYSVQTAYIDASPVPSIDNRSLAANHCTDLTHCRTIWNILWSCLVTIFSCTWVAVHPNIPCPKKRNARGWIEKCIWNPLLSFAEHRLPLFVCALLVPEYMLAWAIRQFLDARKIANENESELDSFYQ